MLSLEQGWGPVWGRGLHPLTPPQVGAEPGPEVEAGSDLSQRVGTGVLSLKDTGRRRRRNE